MKTFAEIKNDTQIQKINNEYENHIDGFLLPRGGKRAFTFVCSIDKEPDGYEWEHVSVWIFKEYKKTPTWEEMCAVKKIFWYDDEEVHQIHPSEKEYFRGFRKVPNVLHLWRPVGGWKR
ncbi:MAG: hypothetical protein J6M62_02570 [Selenomonadaceae bacterium]|nr:hypothetical protein [Selenomonadaceae bacterium]MBP3723810.1 hypothetical protein [Selenomonadaceae bacterium]